MIDPYDVLHVQPTASAAEIRGAYRDAIRRLHPDHLGGSDPDHVAFTTLVDAWKLVGDARARSEFDASRSSASDDLSGSGRLTQADLELPLLDARSSRMIRQAFVVTFILVISSTFVLLVVGMSQSGGR
ncbi:MAG TPA: DnaJ domain-containing protein [Ilumatobacteraceae bacterium]|nr:DnaJ domain-containing protein [Ilumatobacteraceae bacterium]